MVYNKLMLKIRDQYDQAIETESRDALMDH